MSDTQTTEPTAALGSGETSPPLDTGGVPTWVRRSIIGVALLIAFGVLIWSIQTGGSSNDDVIVRGAIVGLSPPNDAQALRQTAVGADLAAGYDGRLTINGIAIPEDQMVGARDPDTVDPADLAKNGVRPNNRNSVYFKPGPGKVIEEFDQGTVTISLKYFKDRREDTTANTVTWTIRVS